MTKKNTNIEELFNQAKQTEEVFSNNEIRSILEKKYSFADRLSQNLISSTITGAKSMYIYSGIAMVSLLAGFLSLSNLFVADTGSQNTQANTKQANVITLTDKNTTTQNDNPTSEEKQTEKQEQFQKVKVVEFGAAPIPNSITDDEAIDIKGVNLIKLNEEELNQIGVNKVSDDTYEISTNNEEEKGTKIIMNKNNIVMVIKDKAGDMNMFPRLITDKNGNKKFSYFTSSINYGNNNLNNIMSLKVDADSSKNVINISTVWNSDSIKNSTISISTDDINNSITTMVTDAQLGATITMPQLNKEDSLFAYVNEVYLDSIQEKMNKIHYKLSTMMPQAHKKAKVMIWNEEAYKWEQKEMVVDIDTNLLDFNEEMKEIEIIIQENVNELEKISPNVKNEEIEELEEIEESEFFEATPILPDFNDSFNFEINCLNKMKLNLDSIQGRITIINNDLTSYIRVNKLVPIALKFPNSSEDVDYILWYDPDTELLNNLPEKYRETIEKEVVASNKEEFCDTKPVAGEETYFDIWRSCAGSIKDMSIFPNPAKEKVSITYTLTEARKISIAIHDLFGKKIAELNPTEMREKGVHTEQFVLQGIESGMYLISIFTDQNETAAQRMIIEK